MNYASMYLIPKALYETLKECKDDVVRNAMRSVNIRQYNNLQMREGTKVAIKSTAKNDGVTARAPPPIAPVTPIPLPPPPIASVMPIPLPPQPTIDSTGAVW